MRQVDKRARFLLSEPLIQVATPPDAPALHAAYAAAANAAQFEAFDMLAGRLAPELGGSEAHLDLVGVNFYPLN